MRFAACPVPVSSSSDSLTTPPSSRRPVPNLDDAGAGSHRQTCRCARPSGYRPGSRVRLAGRRTWRRAAVPGRTTMRVEDLSGDDAAVYRAVAEAEVDAGAAHLQDVARLAGLDLE